ncbi:hypothetical protein KIN20_020425 [Parelaphostrongylus tenuis]|uniref:Uncharacterized protein n=1 Tax=Parelaphostrongylus tenuis TaxID=148309 RepID=A0AAD5QTH8_PARTN|nr:hypothetical protein KIN20_020425 [Parelaphostrongylus tenuis]
MLFILALCLVIIAFIIKFICDKLEIIQKVTIQNPFSCSSHWITTEVHIRDRMRRSCSTPSGADYVKRLRSSSPPPSYDTGQITSSTWGKRLNNEITV